MVPTCQEFHAPIYKILKSESFGEFHYQTDHEYSFHHFVVLFHKFKNKVKPSLARYKGDKSKISGLHEIQCGTQNARRGGGYCRISSTIHGRITSISRQLPIRTDQDTYLQLPKF